VWHFAARWLFELVPNSQFKNWLWVLLVPGLQPAYKLYLRINAHVALGYAETDTTVKIEHSMLRVMLI